ncbi:MAG: transcription factor S [Nanoarchaeota archaeon]|nr:transcription factor S [Nanoarchaeota archaeon]
MVDFCDKCGAIIMGAKGSEVPCPSCGHSNKATSEVKISQKIEKKEEKEIVDTEDASAEVHPIAKGIECPECGHDEARYFSRQMRAGDEPETQFYKCENCKHQWRKHM